MSTMKYSKKEGMFSQIEETYKAAGFRRIAGVDEAGRGALIGPVVAAAVIFPDNVPLPFVFDSKQVSESDREIMREQILAVPGIRYAISEVSAAEIDRINILQATLSAMSQAIQQLSPDVALIDGNRRPKHLSIPLKTIVKGDAKCLSIAAASILAKTYRDTLLRAYALQYPGYGFEHHKGYGTAEHLTAIQSLGILPEHRQTFAPIAQILSPYIQDSLFDE